MRRRDREITDFEKVVSIIDKCDCCRIGLVDDSEAYIVPLNFGFDVVEENIVLYFHCANEGRKLDLIPSQKNVFFEMDTGHKLVGGEKGCDFTFLYQSVMGKGKMEILKNDDERILGLKRIMYHYTKNDAWDFDSKWMSVTNILRLTVSEWSCKEHRFKEHLWKRYG